jgi:hypothetical protein
VTGAGRRPGRPPAAATLLAAALVPFAAAADPVLEVRDETGRALVAAALPPDGRWCLAWNHSVTGEPVLDCFRLEAGALLLERSHQIDFSSAGLGHTPGRGRIGTDGSGGQWIEGIDAPVAGGVLVLRVGAAAVDHRVIAGGAIHRLSAVAPGARVRIAVTDVGP